MSSLNQKAVNRILHPIEGGKIGLRDFMTDEGERTYIDFDTYDYITKKALEGFNPALPIVTHLAEVGDDDVYTLTVDELATINTYTRYPNFVALINGTPFPDIQPTYNGDLGSLTSVTVQLHSDGLGLNVAETFMQFS